MWDKGQREISEEGLWSWAPRVFISKEQLIWIYSTEN